MQTRSGILGRIPMSENTVPSAPQATCPSCGKSGKEVYTNLKDGLLPTPGRWNMRCCEDESCFTYWVDPRPLPEAVHLLYENYHTHSDPVQVIQNRKSLLKRLLDAMRTSVLAEDLGYPSTLPPTLRKVLNCIAHIHPGWRDEQRNQVLHVPYREGHLLDVGCGSGNAMQVLSRWGWQRVSGTDFDPEAVENARRKGLEVHEGDLSDIKFPDESFDAILCCNVIEHVSDPLKLLTECHRILKKGGQLTIITTNSKSRGHMHFREHWRGLEIPRHLQVFTPKALERLGFEAGFKTSIGKSCLQGLYYMWDASEVHRAHGHFELPPPTKWSRLANKVKLFRAGLQLAFMPGKEDSSLLYCKKD